MNNTFIHLRTQSSYSLSESSLKIKNLVHLAKTHNMPALAITDNNNMFGVFEFAQECINNGIQPIIGSSINLLDYEINGKFSQLSFLVINENGYKNLLNLSSLSHLSEKKNIGLSLKDLKNNFEGLYCFVGGEFNPLLFLFNENKDKEIYNLITYLKELFGNNLLFELQRINDKKLEQFESKFISLASKFDISLIASNNIKFGEENDSTAHDALLCIAQKSTVNSTNRVTSNQNLYFKTSKQMRDLFLDIPEVITNNFNVALNCNYFPKETLPKLPKFKIYENLSENDLLIKLSKDGLNQRIEKNNILKKTNYENRLSYELNIINQMGFAGYFLIVADFVNWAKNNTIPVGPGRGSGAGSLVAWSLGITDLDPIIYDLLFERFLNPERVSMPDFDIDFCQDRRDEVIDYVNKKYGRECVAHIITFGTLASRAAVRDIGRVFEIPYGEIDSFAKLIPFNPSNPLTLSESIKSEKALQERINEDERISNVVNISLKLEGIHRHASTHAAGVVIGDSKITNVVPLYKDPNTNINATQFSMKYVEKAGLIKFDFLGLTTLSIIKECSDLIKKENKNFIIETIPLDDKKTFQQLSRGNAVGIFQLESNGMASVLKQLQPDKFEEIIAVVALFRPGPMDNIPSFCNRKHNREKIDYIHPMLEKVLKETYGIIVYQEQVMQIAQVLSNYTLGEADLLRRAMGKKIQKEMDAQKNRFIEGALKNNIKKHEASKIFDLVDKFAGYGFNKSHAAGYGLISYQTAFLKANFPHEFMTATLNYSIDRTDKIILLKKELERLDIKLLKPDINSSDEIFSIFTNDEGEKSIKFGLAAIKGVGIKSIKNLVEEREDNGSYINIIDFLQRVNSDVINKRQLEKLIQSGAFDKVEKNRSKLFNNVPKFVELFGKEDKNIDQNLLFEDQTISFDDKNLFIQNVDRWNWTEELKNELEVIGFYFSDHPLKHYPSDYFKSSQIIKFEKLIADSNISTAKLAGSILDIKERSNKDGKKYAFITISEINNQYELVIFSENLSKYRNFLKEGNLLIFNIDIIRNDNEIRCIIKKVNMLEKVFSQLKKKIDIYTSPNLLIEIKDKVFTSKNDSNQEINVFVTVEDKLVNLSFPKNYYISSFKNLENYKNSNKLDYSLEIS
ncbi:MAG: DNA polymerase III subunit alpha [Pelagibacteraceae bacterium]|nr:DNA polymerase III subunit alpha [Pelagibacteraceae bacterium]|tara:strand:+ start:19665 stop:23072 length:3408 start_codon:yes stop_codon:yes gene_type:complete